MLDRHAALAVDLGSSMVLARLLTPQEIGVFSVTMTMLGLVAAFRDLGTGQYVVQERQLTAERVQSAWAVQAGAGAVLFALSLLASRPLAGFFGEPVIGNVVTIIGFGYIVSPVGSMTYALLMREMRYDAIAVMRLSSSLAGCAVSIGLAYTGHGPASLAWGSLSSTVTTALVSLCFRPSSATWWPRLGEWRRVLDFGVRAISMSILDSLGRGAPDFLLGKLQGFGAAGYYSRASGLTRMFDRLVMDAVYPVALSELARQARAGQDVRAAFVRTVEFMSALAWPFALVVALLAQPLVRTLFGSQWDAAVPLVRLLALAMALGLPIGLSHILLVANGAVGQALRATAWSLVAIVVAAVIGSRISVTALAVSMIGANAVAATIWLVIAQRVIRFDGRAVLRAALPNMPVCAAVGLAPAACGLVWGLEPSVPLLSLLISIPGAAVGWLVAIAYTGHPLAAEVRNLIGRLRRRRDATRAGAD